MTSRTPRIDFYAPKTLAVMDQAFAAIWNVLKADDPFREYAKDGELRIAVGQKLLNLVADGVTDPGRLRRLTVESFLPGHSCLEQRTPHKKGQTRGVCFEENPGVDCLALRPRAGCLCRLVRPHALRPTRASASEVTRTRPASSKLVPAS